MSFFFALLSPKENLKEKDLNLCNIIRKILLNSLLRPKDQKKCLKITPEKNKNIFKKSNHGRNRNQSQRPQAKKFVAFKSLLIFGLQIQQMTPDFHH